MTRFWQYLQSFVLIAFITAIFFGPGGVLDTTLIALIYLIPLGFITAADRVTGTGLGLSIYKGIIEAHGGRIWAENLTDGLAFNFTLPLIWDGAMPSQLPIDLESE